MSIAAFLALAAATALAQRIGTFPGGPVDSKTMRIQQKVEQLFDQREYKRALFIYENELAPIGDKYAQYMVGFMNLTGAGLPEDPIKASAWYRLAAERSNPQFVAIRDQLMATLSEVERRLSDSLYLQLRQKYSDPVIILEVIRKDLESMSIRTGSRLSSGSGAVTIVDPRTGISLSGDDYYRQLSKRIQASARYLARELDLPDVETDAQRIDINALEEAVREHVSTLPDW